MSTEKMEVPAKLRYTKSHEWAREEKGEVVVGITAFAVEEMGHDIVHIDLPPAGKKVKQSESFGVIDSVKAAFDLYAPVGGQIVAGTPGPTDDALSARALPGAGVTPQNARWPM